MEGRAPAVGGILIFFTLFLCSCNFNKTRQEATAEEYKGEVVGLPFKVEVKKLSVSKEERNLDMGIDWGSIIGLGVSLLSGGGLGALFMRSYKDGQIKEITDGVGEFLSTKSGDVDKLLNALSKKMSSNTKKVVRRVKG